MLKLNDIQLKLAPNQLSEYLLRYKRKGWDIYFVASMQGKQIVWESYGDAPEQLRIELHAYSALIKVPNHPTLALTPVQFAEYLQRYLDNKWDIYFSPTVKEDGSIIWTSYGDAPEELQIVLDTFSASILVPMHR